MNDEAANLIGKYRLVGQLGRGGMGIVFQGYDPVIQRNVALKVIRKRELDPRDLPLILERFRREAQAAGNLSHPNIVSVYEYGDDEQHAFIAMECVTGKSLREHLQTGYRPEFREFPEVIDQFLEGLDYSHSRGVIHRDLKPGNLLISESGVVKISDFGIARMETSQLTHVGEVLGTPYYMSPEQFEGKPVDERSDIYSAGVIAYEILTGQRPFNGTATALMKQVLETTPPTPSTIERRLSPELDEVLLKALAKSPADRYPSAREFAGALHQAFDSRPFVHASTPKTPDETTMPREQRDAAPDAPPAKVAGNAAALRRAIGTARAGASPQNADSRADARPEPLQAGPSPRSVASPPAPSAAGPGAGIPVASRASAVRPINESAGPASISGVRRPCVLFVDDEDRVLNALRSIFKNTYDIVLATSGDEALKIVESRHVHLIISDQRMPGMLGVEVLRQVKSMSPATVRMLLTGYSDLAAIVGSVNEGEVYRFINKPWNQQELQQTVAEAVTISLALQASPPREVKHRDPSLVALVLNDDATFRAVRELVASSCQVLHATTQDEALGILAEREVAVLISDLESGRVDNTVLFKVLKDEHPETLVIVTTGASDSELIISLINEARIFRFVNKPLNLTLVQQHIIAALDRYQQFRAVPQLVQSQKAAGAGTARNTSLGRDILERLKSLRGRVASTFRT